jgi:hypothetical protein
MTDAPIADAAPVAAPVSDVAIEPTAVSAPNPVETSIVADKAAERAEAKAAEVAKPPEPKKAKDAGEAVRNAMAKVKADEEAKAAEPEAKKTEIKADAKPVEAKTPDVSPADTKPAAKYEPPSRMSEDAKQRWQEAPEPVQREVDRMHRELSQGIEKYRQAAERDSQLAQFHQLAQQGGKPLAAVIDGYWQAEQAIRRNPVEGLDAVCKNLGFSLRDIAAHVMGQPPEQQQAAVDNEVRQLRQTVQQLQQQLGGVTQNIQQQQQIAHQQRLATVVDKINTFKNANPRYDELEPHMVKLIESGLAKDLPDAYEKAARLNPAPVRLQVSADATAQTPRESKSISGAPTPGSSPAEKRRSSSIRESLQRASARAG